jgi:hypothetical protein
MIESDAAKNILRRVTAFGVTLFRNNVGTGWVGVHTIKAGVLTLKQFRRIVFGLCVGSSDYIGFTKKIIDGKQVAVFTAFEIKRSMSAKRTKEQADFINMVKKNGGIAGFVSTIDDVKAALDDFDKRN